jgi:capsid portal protein
MTTEVRPQASFDDDVLHDPELEAKLEERERAKADKKVATNEYTKVNDEAAGRIVALELEDDQEVRCGRFILSYPAPPEAGMVRFERAPKRRPHIRVVKDKKPKA